MTPEQLLDKNARKEIKKHNYKLTEDDIKALRKTPRLKDLLTKGKITTAATIKQWSAGPGAEDYNVVSVILHNVVPAGFNGKLMCFQQQSQTCYRKVKVTIELI